VKAYVVDDDIVYTMGIKRLLKRINQIEEVAFFDNGKQALDELIANKDNLEQLPNVILLDINMPVMDGWEFLKAYTKAKTQLSKEIIIYMISSSINPSDIERAKTFEDITEYLEKPVTLEDLQQMMEANAHPRK
jgi:CheY-like chemotaxis protein